MQSCASCKKLEIDKEAMKSNYFIDKCTEYNFHVVYPLLDGWKCPKYQRRKRRNREED